MQPNESAEPRARPVLALCALCVVVCDVLLRNLVLLRQLMVLGDLRGSQGNRFLVDFAEWLALNTSKAQLELLGTVLDIVAVPAFVLFLVLIGPKLPRGILARGLLFAASGAFAIAFLDLESDRFSESFLNLGWGCILPDVLSFTAFYFASTASLSRIITSDDRRHPVRVQLGLLVGLYILAPVSCILGWLIFLLVGSVLFPSPRAPFYSDGFNLLFAVAFVAANFFFGRRLMHHWKWQAIGAVFGCIIVAHWLLSLGCVYTHLFG